MNNPKKLKMLDKSYYDTILSQTFSACGNYLLAGNIYGQIAIYNLEKLLNPKFDDFGYSNNAEQIIEVDRNVQICSLASTEKFLVVGTHGEISGWDWSCLKDKAPKPSWKIPIPGGGSFIDKIDVNSLWWSVELEQMFAGCGDNKIYAFNLEQGKVARTYEGHTDYIHSIHGLSSNLISAGEDGLVALWDSRIKHPSNVIKPHTESKLVRPDLGKWMGAASLGEDWIICGGGPRLALWQIRSLQATTVFDLPDHGIHVSYFHDDRIIAAGTAKDLYQLSYSGETIVRIPVSATTVYSAIHQSSPHRVFTIAGSSSNIDLCTTFNYKDQTLCFKLPYMS